MPAPSRPGGRRRACRQGKYACTGGGGALATSSRLAGIDLVQRSRGRRSFAAGIGESFREVVAASLPPLHAASLEQALGEARPRIEVGGAPEASEEYLGLLPCLVR